MSPEAMGICWRLLLSKSADVVVWAHLAMLFHDTGQIEQAGAATEIKEPIKVKLPSNLCGESGLQVGFLIGSAAGQRIWHNSKIEGVAMKKQSQNDKARADKKPDRLLASHDELMADMRDFRKEVTATPSSALDFLKRAGLVTAKGKPKQLIRV
ncbi:hypothetical protein [Azovibrio restrictus]|uniref:hypothetical protein n=1 Tax=Azovibrio restrictus TaxID=146938 RepID=UPI0026EE0BD8|nr:hypothetical protein [Azovibrio restrictus]MDD3483567.1 hypothetical protein [Azovibrio restrictus]